MQVLSVYCLHLSFLDRHELTMHSYEDAGYRRSDLSKVRICTGCYDLSLIEFEPDGFSPEWKTSGCPRIDCASICTTRCRKDVGQEVA